MSLEMLIFINFFTLVSASISLVLKVRTCMSLLPSGSTNAAD